MSTLMGSSKIVDNSSMRARTSAAIRQTASFKSGADGAEGKLAKAALLNPEFVVSAFLVRIAVNGTVVESACHDCGYSGVSDSDILYVVDVSWKEIAEGEFPEGTVTEP